MKLPGSPLPSVGVNVIHSLDGHLYIYHVFGDTTKVVEDKVALDSKVEFHSGKASKLTYTVP